MKTPSLFAAVLLGLTFSLSARAQTPTVATPATSAGTTPVGTSLPSAPPPGMVPANATTPTGISGQLYPNGQVPTRNVNGGTQRADQPQLGRAAVTGSQQTKSLSKDRTSTPR
ncbi:MAG: hypothetical protein ACRYG7_12425 [Janthinobacterium lividum]